jgi:penicillin amidase
VSRLSRKIRRRAALALVALFALAATTPASLYWRWSRAALPQVDGRLRLAGLAAPVTIRRDALGVPHIQAVSALDAVRAQGYACAQDRLWQMDLMRRRAKGELAEAFGEGALRADKEIRTLGLGAAAREVLPLLPPDIGGLLDAYAGGVNAYIETHRDARPLEFRLLRYEPKPWSAVDTVAVGKLLAFDLAQGWDGEAFRAVVGDQLPADVQDLLFPRTFPNDRILVGSDAGGRLSADASPEESGRGSNNWVVSGAHTATGLPLLANDPHLNLGVPSIWTAVHLTTSDGLDVAGVTLPGAPGVILGRNRRVAWGCTNVHDDSADLFVEEFDSSDPDRYRTPEGWAAVAVREETIRVRSGPLAASWREERHPVRLTRHGPLVEIQGKRYALRWTSLEKAPELTAFWRMDRASNWTEFSEALRQFPGPSQNFVYADVDGHIAWYAAGHVPVRRGGDAARPYPGASADGDWLGFVPFEALPHVLDPPSGRIATANNRLTGADYPYRIARGGIGPWRAARILEALESKEGWTTEDMARLQGDRVSIPHRDLARALREAADRHEGDAVWDDVAREMNGWEGALEPGSRAAALAVVAFRGIGDHVIAPRLKLPPDRALVLKRRTAAIHRLVLERPAGWLPAGDADWDAVLRAVWQDAVAEIGASLGGDRARWTYGRINRALIRHPLSRAISTLGLLLNPPEVEMGGGGTTPNVLWSPEPGTIEGPSMRFVANMADVDDTRLVNFMGQSGHPASPHYGDQFEAWVKVETRRLPFSAEAVAREARHTLTLEP